MDLRAEFIQPTGVLLRRGCKMGKNVRRRFKNALKFSEGKVGRNARTSLATFTGIGIACKANRVM